jgi:hypothetical protein
MGEALDSQMTASKVRPWGCTNLEAQLKCGKVAFLPWQMSSLSVLNLKEANVIG